MSERSIKRLRRVLRKANELGEVDGALYLGRHSKFLNTFTMKQLRRALRVVGGGYGVVEPDSGSGVGSSPVAAAPEAEG